MNPLSQLKNGKKTPQLPLDHRVWPGAVVLAAASLLLNRFSLPIASWPLILLAGHLAFFRDPKRKIPPGKNPVSPADGKIVEISIQAEPRYLGEEAVKIGIFLSIFNAHVTRIPMDGKVRYLEYVPGKFLNALRSASSEYNESNWIGCEEGSRRLLLRQIAGAIARRIHCDAGMDDNLERGGKVGIICYGSRVELFIPKRLFRPHVKIGDRVKAGETLLGEWCS